MSILDSRNPLLILAAGIIAIGAIILISYVIDKIKNRRKR